LDEEKPSSKKRKARSAIKEPPGKRHATSSTSKLIGRTDEVEFTDEDFTLALEALKQPATPGPSHYLESPDMTFAVTPAKIFS
jgi:hypothetical protein